MLQRTLLDGTTTDDGCELELTRHGDDFFIDIDQWELMSSRAHGSEEQMASLALDAFKGQGPNRWLVGGLGMGFTLRATLDASRGRGDGRVIVSEVFQAVVDWNRGPLAHLADSPLDDPRAEVVIGDVYDLIDPAGEPFDIILLDVDNGPDAFTLRSNERLYHADGLRRIRDTLSPGGVLAIWSSADHEAFRRRLGKAGFEVRCRRVRSRPDRRGLRHTIFLAQPRTKERPRNRRKGR